MLTDLSRAILVAHMQTVEVQLKQARKAITGLSMAKESVLCPGLDIDALGNWWAEAVTRLEAEVHRCRSLLAASPTH